MKHIYHLIQCLLLLYVAYLCMHRESPTPTAVVNGPKEVVKTEAQEIDQPTLGLPQPRETQPVAPIEPDKPEEEDKPFDWSYYSYVEPQHIETAEVELTDEEMNQLMDELKECVSECERLSQHYSDSCNMDAHGSFWCWMEGDRKTGLFVPVSQMKDHSNDPEQKQTRIPSPATS